MSLTMPLESRDLALELHRLLRDLDPARWRDGLHSTFRERLAGLQVRIQAVLESTPRERLATVHARLLEVARFIDEHAPRTPHGGAEARAAWQTFRERMVPAYEQLAAGLRMHKVHVPSLRPTNYARNLFHVSWALAVLFLIERVIDVTGQRWFTGVFAVYAWGVEALRRSSPDLNARVMKLYGRVAHPHEWHRINSATWYVTALLILSWTCPPMVSAVAVAVLGFADPAAALIGRRWGRHKLVNGRSLEGTLTFAVVGTAVSFGLMAGLHAVPMGTALLAAAAAAVPAALAELFSGRVDDNFSIPLAAAVGAGLALGVWG